MGIEGIAAEVQRVAQTAEADGNARVLDGDYAGAKRVLTAAQKELRLLKRDALDEERKIREAFQDQRLKVSKSGQTLGLFVNSKTRSAMSKGRAMEKRSLAGPPEQSAETICRAESPYRSGAPEHRPGQGDNHRRRG